MSYVGGVYSLDKKEPIATPASSRKDLKLQAYNPHPNKSTLGTLVGVGMVAGFISALVKSGVETLLPPRLPTAVPPPIGLLDMMGLDAATMDYFFNQTTVNWGGNGLHILFSLVIAVLYVWLVEQFPKISAWWGLPFGWIVATLGAHCIVLPLLGVAPPLWETGTAGLISELVGTAIWIWTIECVRRAMLGRAAVGYGLPGN